MGEEYVFPLSFQQTRLWLLEQLETGNPAYHVPIALRIGGPLDVEALRRALTTLTRRHEILRTRLDRNAPVQIVTAHADPELKLVILSGTDELETTVRDLARRPFDLWATAPVRHTVLRIDPRTHVLLIVLHHAICDGWSTAVLAQEIIALYRAEVEGAPPDLPVLTAQYGDFALWQREQLSGERLEAELRHWCDVLAAAPPALELPADRPRPRVQTYRGARVQRQLDGTTTMALRERCRRLGISRFMMLLAAYSAVLGRLADQADLVIGTPTAGRTAPETHPLVGCFVDVLPLRVDLSGDPAITELLGRMRHVCLDAYAHQEAPFERVVERLAPGRDLSRPPVFQAMLALQDVEQPKLTCPGLEITEWRLDTGVAKYDLTLDAEETAGEMRLDLEYNADLFDHSTARSLLDRVVRALHWLTEAPGTAPLSELDIMLPGEVSLLRGREMPIPNATVADLVRQQVIAHPDRTAVADQSRVLTYRQLWDKASDIAALLAYKGVRRGDVVGVQLPRTAELPAALLGVWLAGAAYLPLDHRLPPDRRQRMIDDAGARVVLTGTATSTARTAGVRCGGEDPAYVMFTSGSTGHPKGVVVPHRAVVNLLLSIIAEPGLTPSDRLVAVTTTSFDISVLELFAPLVAGAQVVIASDDQISEPELLGELIGTATVVQATPSTWRWLLDSGWTATRPLRVLCGGEALPAALADRLTTDHEVWNLYGPTETTIWSAISRVDGEVTLGHPLANTTVRVLDRNLRPVPPGVLGEIHLGGSGVAHGYLNQPALTADRFVPDPDGGRMYRTGDLGRLRPDGTLVFAGRNDHQVKVLGHRVEPGEVEAHLATHPAVAACAVVARSDHLVACVVPDGPAPTLTALKDHLSRSLPAYLIPAALTVLDELPTTANGKLDRAALSSLAARPNTADHVPPADELERAVLDCFRQVLDVPGLGMTDDFFQHGGSSLTAVQLVAAVEEATGTRLELRRVFESPTAFGLVAAVRSTPEVTGSADHDLIREVGRAATLPADIVVGQPHPDGWHPRHVLLLGAAEPLGAAVLHSVLAEQDVVVSCLLGEGGAVPQASDRVRLVIGHLDQVHFGLDADSYARLVSEVSAVFHVADVFAPPAELHRASATTVEAIRFAATGKAKPLHHVSIADVSVTEGEPLEERLYPLTVRPDSLPSLVPRVGETLVYEAALRGLPTCILRTHPQASPARAADTIVALAHQPAANGHVVHLPPGSITTAIRAERAAALLRC
ncbi:non-ribosomal peptide synthetase [Lentzea flava]|nr:non-ribosomal peptide synthetase [Lentzea flava]